MSHPQQPRPQAPRSRPRTVVVWGCTIHLTKAGGVCQGYRDQGKLFARSDVTRTRRSR